MRVLGGKGLQRPTSVGINDYHINFSIFHIKLMENLPVTMGHPAHVLE